MLFLPHLRLEDQQHRHERYKGRHGQVQELPVDINGQECPDDGTECRYSRKRKGDPKGQDVLSPVRLGPRKTLKHDGDPVGTVRQGDVHPEKRKKRQDQQGPSAANGVEKPRNDPNEKDPRP